jgi:hypothetical protein
MNLRKSAEKSLSRERNLSLENLRFDDGIEIFEEHVVKPTKTVTKFSAESRYYGMFLNTNETKTGVFFTTKILKSRWHLRRKFLRKRLGNMLILDLNCFATHNMK